MNYTKLESLKSKGSNWSILFFIGILVIGTLGSIFFQAPTKLNPVLSRMRMLIPSSHIESVNTLTFTNRLGIFELEKVSDEEWILIRPRKLPAKQKTIKKIFDTLLNIKIRKVLPKDLVNISNYSLQSPVLKIKLGSTSNDDQLDMSFGLINPIDRSTYTTLENNDAIYHISKLDASLQTLSLGDFVDTGIFPVSPDKILSFEVFKGNPLRSDLKLSIYKDKEHFKNKRGLDFSSKKVLKFFKNVHDLKSYFLIDKQSPKLGKQINHFLKNPLYTVLIKDINGKKYSFKLTGTINSLSGIKMEKRKYFLISASHRKHQYLVSKKYLRLFYKTKKSFKTSGIKKLFY